MKNNIIYELAYGFLRDIRHSLLTIMGVVIILLTSMLGILILYAIVLFTILLWNTNWLLGSSFICLLLLTVAYNIYIYLDKLGD